jgi:hypothetical protein
MGQGGGILRGVVLVVDLYQNRGRDPERSGVSSRSVSVQREGLRGVVCSRSVSVQREGLRGVVLVVDL